MLQWTIKNSFFVFRLWGLCIGVLGQAANTELNAQIRLSDQYRNKAEILAARGEANYVRALQYYHKSYDIVIKHDLHRAANLCNDISSIWFMKKEPQRAIAYCHQGLSLLQSQPDVPDSLRFKLFSSLGVIFKVCQVFDSSVYYFQKAQAFLDKKPTIEKEIPDYIIHHYNNYGQLYLDKYRYNQALVYLQEARRLIAQYHRDGDLPYVESSLAECYHFLKDYAEALRYRQRAFSHTTAGFSELKQGLGSAVGYTFQQIQQLDSALYWYQKALSINISGDKSNERARIKLAMASCYRLLNQLDKARECLKQAQKLLKKTDMSYQWLASNLIIEEAALYVTQRHYSQARIKLKHAVELLGIKQNQSQTWPKEGILSKTLLLAYKWEAIACGKQYQQTRKIYNLQAAFDAFSRAIFFQNHIYSAAALERSERYALASYRQSLFEDAWPIAYSLYQQKPSSALLEQIFGWFEAAQSEYLRGVLYQQATKQRAWSSQQHQREQQLLQERIEAFQHPYLDSLATMKAYDSTQWKWYRFRESVDFSSQYLPAGISMAQLKRQLPSSTAYVAYQWQGSFIYAYIITNTEIRFQRWSVNDAMLKKSLENIKNELYTNPHFGNYQGTQPAIDCFQQLIEPIWPLLKGHRHWVFNRDGLMNSVPFEVFETGRRKEDYLLKYAAISYTFSASSLWGRPYLLPEYSSQKELVFAPFVEGMTPNPKMKWKAVEVLRNLQDVYTKVWWGEQATKKKLLEADFERPLFYIATHAEVDEQFPQKSFLQLYPNNNDRLYLEEIAYLPLSQTHLTILGTCHSGRGKEIWGEGSVSLAKAVIEAGCPSVVSSVWEANEKSMRYLIANFREQLRRGTPIDLALQTVKLQAIASEKMSDFKHPYYWANLMLIGQSRPIYSERDRLFYWPWLVLFLTITLGVAWIWRRVKH